MIKELIKSMLFGIQIYISIIVVGLILIGVPALFIFVPFKYILYALGIFVLTTGTIVALGLYFHQQKWNKEQERIKQEEMEKAKVKYIIIK